MTIGHDTESATSADEVDHRHGFEGVRKRLEGLGLTVDPGSTRARGVLAADEKEHRLVRSLDLAVLAEHGGEEVLNEGFASAGWNTVETIFSSDLVDVVVEGTHHLQVDVVVLKERLNEHLVDRLELGELVGVDVITDDQDVHVRLVEIGRKTGEHHLLLVLDDGIDVAESCINRTVDQRRLADTREIENSR